MSRNEQVVEKYRKFVRNLVAMTAGGPPAEELVNAIETDTLNMDSFGHMLGGFKFESYTDPPKHPIWQSVPVRNNLDDID